MAIPNPPSGNGWSRYEIAVLADLEEIKRFIVEARAFMTGVQTTLGLHADHPTRLARLEEQASERDRVISTMIWKIGVIGVGTGVIFGGIVNALIRLSPLAGLFGL